MMKRESKESWLLCVFIYIQLNDRLINYLKTIQIYVK